MHAIIFILLGSLSDNSRQQNKKQTSQNKNNTQHIKRRTNLSISTVFIIKPKSTIMGKRKQANPAKNAAAHKDKSIEKMPDVKKEPVKPKAELAAEHLPPISLVFTVFVLSGSLFVLGLRDALATGKPIAGSMDQSMLVSFVCVFLFCLTFYFLTLIMYQIQNIYSFLRAFLLPKLKHTAIH